MNIQAKTFGVRTVGFRRGFDEGRLKDRRLFVVLGSLVALAMCAIIGFKVYHRVPAEAEMRKLAAERAEFEATAKSWHDQSAYWKGASREWFNKYVGEVNKNTQSFDKGYEAAKKSDSH
jgi:hypothetical protein